MIYSMTGFGKASGSSNGLFFEVEIKSVNSRFLEVGMRLPASLQSREFEIREFLREKIKRGKISLYISQRSESGTVNSDTIDKEKFSEIISLLRTVKEEFGLKEDVGLSHLTAFKELFVIESEGVDDESFEGVKKVLGAAVENLSSMRGKEGDHLKDDLLSRLKLIDEALERIMAAFKSTLKEHFEKQKERARELVAESNSFNERLELELALLTDKADITEECTRLKSHIKVFTNTLNSGGEVGRKLNFLCQELHRESNTISAKSIAAEIIHETLLIKEEIEKIKEQVQNIE
ncbi:MAG: YicC family protein [Ignavibacteriaceae bacterium]|nr:YicC family protein [Ignavibacteriaceae bacterium]